MKSLSRYFIILLISTKNAFAGKEPPYALTLEALEHCKGTNYRDYVSFDTLKIWPNHTSSGYIEILQDFPMDAMVKFQAFTVGNDTWIPSSLSLNKLDFCRFIEKDVWFVPVGRMVLPIPERCPMRKGHLPFKSVVLHKRSRGIVPFGCFKGRLTMMNKESTIVCVEMVTKITDFSKKYEHPCIDP